MWSVAKVGANAVADAPALDLGADRNDLACHVRAWDDVLFLRHRVLALGDDEVAVLERYSVNLDEHLGRLELRDRSFSQGEVVEAIRLIIWKDSMRQEL